MYCKTITNPKTGRKNKVRAWKIDPDQIVTFIKEGTVRTPHDLSWMLLDDDQSIQVMEEEFDGDSAERNFALSVFENALDWTLGLAILRFIEAAAKLKKLPKPFDVAVNRQGQVFIIGASGTVYTHLPG